VFPPYHMALRSSLLTLVNADLYEATHLLNQQVANLPFLPPTHISAFETYVRTLLPSQSSPAQTFHSTFLAIQSTMTAMLNSLGRPPQLVTQVQASRRAVERSYNSLSRSTRWPLGLLDETRQRLNEEKEEKAREKEMEVKDLGRELRYTQQVVAGELAGWQDMHEKMARRAIKEFARGMVIVERERLAGLRRAMRKLREVPTGPVFRMDSISLQAEAAVDELEARQHMANVVDLGLIDALARPIESSPEPSTSATESEGTSESSSSSEGESSVTEPPLSGTVST
jgi:hypothetical protein